MRRSGRWRRRLAPAAVVALAVSAAHGAPSTYLARREPLGGVRLMRLGEGREAPVEGVLGHTEWRRFELRFPCAQEPSSGGEVREIEGDIPRLQVRSDYQLIAFTTLVDGASGIAWVSPMGAEVIRLGDGDRYRPRTEGAVLSPDGGHLALVIRGEEAEEVLVIDIAGPAPVAREVSIPIPYREVERRSLAMIRDRVFFAVLDEDARWVVMGAPAGPGPGPIEAEPVAGPFDETPPYMACSKSAAAFLGGPDMDRLDVFLAGSAGQARNVTSSPGPYLPHRPTAPRMAVSEDGRSVAYNLVEDDIEVYLHAAGTPGDSGRKDITADERFNPYIIQESVIFFSGGRLIFGGGHDPVTVDLFRVVPSEELAVDVINLTRTGSGLLPPFRTKGTLTVLEAARAGPDLVLLSAVGFPGAAEPGIVLVSLTTGETVLEAPDLTDPSGFFHLGVDLHLLAGRPTGERVLLRVRGGRLVELGASPAGISPALLLLAAERAFVSLPYQGILELRAGEEPRTIVPGGPFAPAAALSADGSRLIFGRPAAGGGHHLFAVDLATLVETPLSAASLEGEVLALGGSATAIFLRGDASGDGVLDLTDAITTLEGLFVSGNGSDCPDAADANDDGRVDISDPIIVLFHLFAGGGAPPAPYPATGYDPTVDALGCPRGV